MRFTGAQHHGVGEAALLAEPVLGEFAEFLDRVLGEKFRGDRAFGGLFGDCLGAVLAELGEFAVPRCFRPGTSGTVKAVTLIQLGQRCDGAQWAHLFEAALQGNADRGHSRGDVLRAGDGDIGFADLARPGFLVVANRRYPVPGHASHSGPVVEPGCHNPRIADPR